MKALLIGSNGYLGRHLAHHLQKNGYEVITADIAEASKDTSFQYISCDASIYSNFKNLPIETVEVIYFFTGLTGTSAGFQKYEDFIKVNEITLLNLLKAHTECQSKAQIIFPSTRLVYKGIANTPLKEDSEKEFKTVYAINKYACEQYLEMWGRNFNTPYTILRLCVPYGNMLEGAYSYGTLGFFLGKATVGQPITLYGDGSLKRTFTHIADVCTYFQLAAENPNMQMGIFNIPGDDLSLKEVATLISEKYASHIEYVPFPISDLLIESGDTIFNGQKIKTITNYVPYYTIKNWVNQLD